MANGSVFKVKVEGLRELEHALQQFSKPTQRNIIKRTLIRAADPIVEDAKGYAPFRTGRLRDSIVASAKVINDVGKREFGAAMSAGLGLGAARQALRDARRAESRSHVEIYVGPTQDAWYATFQEFGTVNNAPHPFLRPAWDANKNLALDIIKQDMWSEIEKAAQRAARKAAKQLAKMR